MPGTGSKAIQDGRRSKHVNLRKPHGVRRQEVEQGSLQLYRLPSIVELQPEGSYIRIWPRRQGPGPPAPKGNPAF